jgi:formylglycine-generating enzyme required for sulfatase activity
MEHPPEQNPGLCVNDHEGFAQTLPVCSRPKGNSPEGICDLSGNVAEWVADLFIPKPRPREFANKPIPPQPRDEGDEGPRHVVKGGAGHYRSHTARSRWACHQALMWDNGFRCAKDGAAR